MKVVAIVQARMGSTRLPGKVMRKVGDVSMVELVLGRLSRARRVDSVVLATSDQPENQQLADHVAGLGFAVERGSEKDVLDRYYRAAVAQGADVVVRVTADCPLIDPAVVDQVIEAFQDQCVDYMSNVTPPTFPDGLDVEVFSFAALEQAARDATAPAAREHVTPYLRGPGFRTGNLAHDEDLSGLRWTVDEASDLEVIRAIYARLGPGIHFSWTEVLDLIRADPQLLDRNAGISRNEGTDMGRGQKLWKRAKNIIPGGNMLLSKRAEMYLPDLWPAYFSRAKGCRVWDMDDRELIDMSVMGIGTNIMGYGHPDVDDAVRSVVNSGNMSTLNCPEEVYLAEWLVELNPWAEMVRFARTGGEANAIAIRIARAASGRDGVAICGYHGWHDWYLSANLGSNSALEGHLLPGLSPKGVPQGLRGSVHPFNYNDFTALEELVAREDIGVIKMEVIRNSEPEDDFLGRVRRLADANGIVLVFDECTSGFREVFGGLHKKYGVEPDIAVYGKTLGNGYAITATVGRREVMEAAQSTFISSTFWTERIGPAAALKTLEVMERDKPWETITATGTAIRAHWTDMADRHGLKIAHWGLPSLAGFTFQSDNALAYKTLITQEMLKKGYLAATSIYACTAHTPEIVDDYVAAIDPIFATIRECEDGRDVMALLEGPVCHSGFKRLN